MGSTGPSANRTEETRTLGSISFGHLMRTWFFWKAFRSWSCLNSTPYYPFRIPFPASHNRERSPRQLLWRLTLPFGTSSMHQTKPAPHQPAMTWWLANGGVAEKTPLPLTDYASGGVLRLKGREKRKRRLCRRGLLTSTQPLGSSKSRRALLYCRPRSNTQCGSRSLTRKGEESQNMCLRTQRKSSRRGHSSNIRGSNGSNDDSRSTNSNSTTTISTNSSTSSSSSSGGGGGDGGDGDDRSSGNISGSITGEPIQVSSIPARSSSKKK